MRSAVCKIRYGRVLVDSESKDRFVTLAADNFREKFQLPKEAKVNQLTRTASESFGLPQHRKVLSPLLGHSSSSAERRRCRGFRAHTRYTFARLAHAFDESLAVVR